MRYAINQATLMKTNMQDFLSSISEAGFTGVELRRDETFAYLKDHSISDLNDLLKINKLEAISWNAIELFSLCTEKEFESMLEYSERLMKIGGEIGCDMIIAVPSFMENPDALNEQKIIEKTVDRFKILRKLGNEYSFKLGFEPLGPETNSVRKIDRAMKILSLAEEDGYAKSGLVIDTFHFFVGENVIQDLQIAAKKLWLVHVNDCPNKSLNILTDADRVMPGTGAFPLEEFSEMLQKISYDGYASIELFNPEFWEQDIQKVSKLAYESTKNIFK